MKGNAFRKIALNLIKVYGTNNPFKLAKYLNIKIIFADFVSYLGLYTKVEGSDIIFINNDLPEVSQTIVCSHEVGHSFQPFEETVFLKEEFLFGKERIESEANIFAATLMFSKEIDDSELTDSDRDMLEHLKQYYLYLKSEEVT